MNLDVLALYSVFSFFYIISPGPAIFLAISNGMAGGMRPVTISSSGNISGLLILSCISISGLGVVLTSSASLFLMVKIIGALYLVYLGIKQFRAGAITAIPQEHLIERPERSSFAYFTEGFLLALTNPKAILFFMALFPQFISLKNPLVEQFLLLTAIFMFLSFASLFSYGFIGKSARSLFANQLAMTWFHRITGGLFIGMGVGLLQLENARS